MESNDGRADGKLALEVMGYCTGIVDNGQIFGYLVDAYP